MTTAVQPLPTASGNGPFSLAQFVQSVAEPLVCLKFGAQWCGPCKQVAPLFEGLAQNAVGAIKCFTVDVEDGVGEQLAVQANVSNLPTFVFYTTQLSPNNELQVIETVVGTNTDALQMNFSKGVHIAHAFQAQKNGSHSVAPPTQPPAVQTQGTQRPAPPQPSQPQPHTSPAVPAVSARNDEVLKRELLEIRAALIGSVQRIEQLYKSLQ